MHDVVVMAVRAAVSAAITIFSAISTILFFSFIQNTSFQDQCQSVQSCPISDQTTGPDFFAPGQGYFLKSLPS